LAYDSATTTPAAKGRHSRAARPNLFIKLQWTKAGLPAIEEAIFSGVSVNVTLLFSPGNTSLLRKRISRESNGASLPAPKAPAALPGSTPQPPSAARPDAWTRGRRLQSAPTANDQTVSADTKLPSTLKGRSFARTKFSFDSPSIFGALLDGVKGGRFQISPIGADVQIDTHAAMIRCDVCEKDAKLAFRLAKLTIFHRNSHRV